MEEKLISFETSQLAKEKGFKSKSRYYDGWGDLVKVPNIPDNDYRHSNNMMQRFRYEAPTQSILQKWLREKHHINIGIHHEFNMKFFYSIQNILKSFDEEWISFPTNDGFETYEEALEEALLVALREI